MMAKVMFRQARDKNNNCVWFLMMTDWFHLIWWGRSIKTLAQQPLKNVRSIHIQVTHRTGNDLKHFDNAQFWFHFYILNFFFLHLFCLLNLTTTKKKPTNDVLDLHPIKIYDKRLYSHICWKLFTFLWQQTKKNEMFWTADIERQQNSQNILIKFGYEFKWF